MPEGIDADTLLFDETIVEPEAPEETEQQSDVAPEGEEGANKEPLVVFKDEKTGEVIKSYEDVDAVRKALQEKEEYLSRKDRDITELKQRLAQAERIEKLEQQAVEANTKAKRESAQKELEQLRKDLDDNPSKALDLLMDQDRYFSEQLSALKSELREELLKRSDDYSSHQEMVDALRAEGMPLDKAIAFAQKHAPKSEGPARQPKGGTPPPTEQQRAPGGQKTVRKMSGVAASTLASFGFGEDVTKGVEKRLTQETA